MSRLRYAKRLSGVERSLIRRIVDRAPADVIDLGLGQPDLPVPEAAALAATRAIQAGETGYSSTAGSLELRRRVVSLHPEREAGPENVLITVGSQEALCSLFFCLVDADREVLVPDPGYPAYATLARLAGGVPRSYPIAATDRFRLRAATVLERVSERTALVVLAGPANPSGACHDAAELRDLIPALEKRGVPWVSDELYRELCFADDAAWPGSFSDGSGFVVSGVSKSASMTGWRVGWLIGAREAVERLTTFHQYAVTCAPTPGQVAARAAITALAEEGEGRRRAYRDRAERVLRKVRGIRGLRMELPEGGLFAWIDARAHGSSLELAERLLDRQRVMLIPGEAFGGGGAGFLRLSLSAGDEELERGLGRIEEELGSS